MNLINYVCYLDLTLTLCQHSFMDTPCHIMNFLSLLSLFPISSLDLDCFVLCYLSGNIKITIFHNSNLIYSCNCQSGYACFSISSRNPLFVNMLWVIGWVLELCLHGIRVLFEIFSVGLEDHVAINVKLSLNKRCQKNNFSRNQHCGPSYSFF